ncbi:MAG: hypothetical protein COB73_08525 [Flavobacteriaceae bacterium]|nr:MAG: hypothetical protein COB73_08525 [Flavobacteriaceae bacterium]
MENRVINLAAVAEVAEALKTYNNKMVFVGGAVVSLYTDDAAAGEIRPTGDVDMTLNVINLSDWATIQEDLGQLGFHPDPFGHAICSYKYKDIPVDIMASEDGPLGPANRWYKIGFNDLWKVKAKTQEISILKAPCYLATKFEAFSSRGKDYRTSHDMEDIIYILDNRIDIVSEIENSPKEIKGFIQSELKKMVDQSLINEVLEAHIHPLVIDQRHPIVMSKITQIIYQ